MCLMAGMYVHVCVFADVYVFGIGTHVNKAELNSLASNKRNEDHLFLLENYKVLGDVFNAIISEWTQAITFLSRREVR